MKSRRDQNATNEHRASTRLNHKATVMIETRDGRDYNYGTMYNFSGDGMYCGTDFALNPGTAITIRFETHPFEHAPKIYVGEIQRCEKLESFDNSHLFGLGVKIIKAFYG